MNLSLLIAGYSLAFLLLVSFSLFGFIIVRRVVREYQKQLSNKLYETIEKEVLEAVAAPELEPSRQLALRYRPFPHVLTRVLLDYGQVISGKAKERLKLIFDLSLRERCRKLLSSRWTSRRLKGARLFFVFFDSTESSVLLKILQDKPIVKLTAITTLLRVSDPATLDFIFQAFERDSGPPVRSYFNIMIGLGEKIESYVKESLRKNLPLEKIALLIELVGAIPLRNLAGDLMGWATHPNKEIRVKVARALGKLLIPDSVDLLLRLAQDEAWEVQAQAVKSLGHLREPRALEALAHSLFSPHWFVRHNAAQALSEMGWEGIAQLKKIAAQDEDRYAREMSTMILNEMAILGEAG